MMIPACTQTSLMVLLGFFCCGFGRHPLCTTSMESVHHGFYVLGQLIQSLLYVCCTIANLHINILFLCLGTFRGALLEVLCWHKKGEGGNELNCDVINNIICLAYTL